MKFKFPEIPGLPADVIERIGQMWLICLVAILVLSLGPALVALLPSWFGLVLIPVAVVMVICIGLWALYADGRMSAKDILKEGKEQLKDKKIVDLEYKVVVLESQKVQFASEMKAAQEEVATLEETVEYYKHLVRSA